MVRLGSVAVGLASDRITVNSFALSQIIRQQYFIVLSRRLY